MMFKQMQRRMFSSSVSFDASKLAQMVGSQYADTSYDLTDHREKILYALSIGFSSKDATNINNLKYTYEKHPQFSIFLTMLSALALRTFPGFT